MPDYSLFPTTQGTQFSFDDFRSSLDVGNNQPISFADLYTGGVYVPENNNYFTCILDVPSSGEISLQSFQSSYSLSNLVFATPDISNHREDEVSRTLISIDLDTGHIPIGKKIYYELEPATGISDSDFTADDVLTMTGRIGNTLTGLVTVVSEGNVAISISFKADVETEGDISLRVKLPGLSNTSPIGTLPHNHVVASPLDDTSTNFINLNFADTTVLSTNSLITEITGWTIQKQHLRLGKSTGSVYSGSGITWNNSGTNRTFTAPVDPSPTPSGNGGTSGGDFYNFSSGANFGYEFKSPTDTVQGGSTQLGYSCIRLFNSGTTTNGYDVVHGPLLKGKVWIPLTTSDSVRFKWRAVGGGDAYDIFAWLQEWGTNDSTDIQQVLLNQTQSSVGGDSGWQTVTASIAVGGIYSFGFMCGTFDYSGGQAAGANLYVTDIEVI